MNELFNNLMALIDPKDISKFFFKDVYTQLGTKCRVFSYNYASYTDWVKPDALESRGIMFELDAENKPVRIMARPMCKFFNLNETPFTMDLDLSELEYSMTKADGSLISTYIDQGILFTKSKTSISSTQAIEAKQLLLDIRYKDLMQRATELAIDGYTCNFEYVAPNNRIVLSYADKDLILLNVRHNETGEYIPIGDLKSDPVLRKYLVDVYPMDGSINPEELVSEIRKMTDIEGFVFYHKSGLNFKLKTEWYSNLHRVKDTLNNNEALFMVVASGGSDDMKSLFTDDLSREKIEAFEIVFLDYLKTTTKLIFDLRAELKGTDRKTYAQTAQNTLRNVEQLELFGVMMELYKGASHDETINNINNVFLKNYKKYVPEKYVTTVKIEY